MPQMAPLNWIFLYYIFIILFIVVMVLNFYNYYLKSELGMAEAIEKNSNQGNFLTNKDSVNIWKW